MWCMQCNLYVGIKYIDANKRNFQLSFKVVFLTLIQNTILHWIWRTKDNHAILSNQNLLKSKKNEMRKELNNKKDKTKK